MRKPDLSDGLTYCTLPDGRRVCTGARLGRSTIAGDRATSTQPVKVTLQRVYIDHDGYDRGGAYWGIGQPLYWACAEAPGADEVSTYFRATDRTAAKQHVRKQFPNAKFYN